MVWIKRHAFVGFEEMIFHFLYLREQLTTDAIYKR